MNLSNCKIGDKIKIPLVSCGCCLTSNPDANWQSDGETKTTTVVLLDIASDGRFLLVSENNRENVFSNSIFIDPKYLPYKYGGWFSIDFQCELAPKIKTISEFNVGDQVKIEISQLARMGYSATKPLIGTIIKDTIDKRGLPCIAWKIGSGVSINYVRAVNDPNFPDLSEGIFAVSEAEAELITPAVSAVSTVPVVPTLTAQKILPVPPPMETTMKKIGDLAPGTRVRISKAEALKSGATVELPLEGTIIKNTARTINNEYPCVAWTEAEHPAKQISINEKVRDPNFPLLTQGCHFYADTEVEEVPVEKTKRLLKDCKPGDRVRIMPADAKATSGNGSSWWPSEEPLDATVITYQGQDRFCGCTALAWDPKLSPDERRSSTTFNEGAFPLLTKGLFVMPETLCELIEAAPEPSKIVEIVKEQAEKMKGEDQTKALKDTSSSSALSHFKDMISPENFANLQKMLEELGVKAPEFKEPASDKGQAEPKLSTFDKIAQQITQAGTPEEAFAFDKILSLCEMSEEEEKFARRMTDVFDKIERRFDQIEEQERAGELDNLSALEKMSDLLQAIEDGLSRAEPGKVAEPGAYFGDHSQPLHLPKDKEKKGSSQTGFLLACAAAGVGLSGLAASSLPAPKKPRKKANKSATQR
jgi:hypothetical protein